MSEQEYEAFLTRLSERKKQLLPYEVFVKERLQSYSDTSAAQMHDWLKEHHADFPKVDPKTVYNFVHWVRDKHNIMWIYTYNGKGQEIKLERYEWWNGRKSCIIEIYQTNNFGDSEKTEFHDCKGLTKNENINYKYDGRENWIFKQVNSDDVNINKIIKRIITYY